MQVRDKVTSILVDILDVSESELDFEQSLATAFDVTSVILVEIIAALENEFDIDIPEDDAPELKTPEDIVKYIESKVAA